jgi:hypothetical protein
MLACGLPVVDLDLPGMRTAFGPDGPIALTAFDPLALCDEVEGLLDDLEARMTRTRAGLETAAGRHWARAAAAIALELSNVAASAAQ